MDLKLDTVQDVIEVQGLCVELSSRLEDMNESIKGLLPCAKDALVKAVKVLDFFSDEVLPNLSVNH